MHLGLAGYEHLEHRLTWIRSRSSAVK
jgi:hypothetical protein